MEYLEKKGNLGEIEPNPNFRLSDEQYQALVEHFKSDKETKSQAEKLISRHQKEKKPAVKEEPAPSKSASETKIGIGKLLQGLNPISKINLDSLKDKLSPKKGTATATAEADSGRAPVDTATTTPTDTTTATEKEAEAESSGSTPHDDNPQPAATTKSESEPEPTDRQAVEEQTAPPAQQQPGPEQPGLVQPGPAQTDLAQPGPVTKTEATPAEQTKPTEETSTADKKVFTLKSEHDLSPKVNVIGKMDLSTINQSTRPKKKTKEERRKERENSNGQAQQTANANGGERRKRARINKARIDIDAAAKQQPGPTRTGSDRPKPAQTATRGADAKKKGRGRDRKPLEVSGEDVARQVKETLARLTTKSQNKKGAKYRKEKRDAVQEHLRGQRAEADAASKVLKLTEFVTVSELANMMNISVTQVIGTCMSIGIMVSINQRLDAETINLVADEFGFSTEYVSAEVQEAITETADDETDLVPRAPIVTVMGHVDHGKTSLLDHIRNTNVIAGEAGGITQHIGAYNVTLADGRRITFLDTPGHEAFTAMRARGAQVTDIAIIIIAADDSVMPTTREAIAHAQAANVPMVFAINKIDKPGANADKIREDLAQMNLLVEDWGGKYQCQEISAKKGIGVDELLEKVLLEAEMLELKANPNRRATGNVIESSLDKGRGYISTVLVSNGTLHVGDVVIAGKCHGKIKAMFNERNQRIEQALPAEPAIILGLNGAPTAGDSFHIMDTEQEAREIANKRLQLQREQGLRTQKRLSLDDISHRIALGSFKELNIVVKGDTDGSIEALSDSFIKLSTEKIKVNVIQKAVGQISENDVMLADASDAIIIGFQVRPSAAARKLAESDGVEINTYSVIYDAIEDVRSAMEGMLDKVVKEEVTAEVEVRQVYKISKVGTVAGAYVTDGKVHRSDKARVIRDGIVIHTGAINALKRFKDDVKEVATNFECGISLVNFNDILQGDIIETFTETEVRQQL